MHCKGKAGANHKCKTVWSPKLLVSLPLHNTSLHFLILSIKQFGILISCIVLAKTVYYKD